MNHCAFCGAARLDRRVLLQAGALLLCNPCVARAWLGLRTHDDVPMQREMRGDLLSAGLYSEALVWSQSIPIEQKTKEDWGVEAFLFLLLERWADAYSRHVLAADCVDVDALPEVMDVECMRRANNHLAFTLYVRPPVLPDATFDRISAAIIVQGPRTHMTDEERAGLLPAFYGTRVEYLASRERSPEAHAALAELRRMGLELPPHKHLRWIDYLVRAGDRTTASSELGRVDPSRLIDPYPRDKYRALKGALQS